MQTVVVIAIVMALIAAFVLLESRRRSRRIEAAFSGRPTSNAGDALLSQFPDVSPKVVVSVREILEEQLGTSLDRLSSKDDFSTNLKFFFDYDSLVAVSIVMALEERFDIKITDEEAQASKTVEDLVRLVWRKQQNAA